MDCSACGQTNRADVRYCTACGTRLADASGTHTIVMPTAGFARPAVLTPPPAISPTPPSESPPSMPASAHHSEPRPWTALPGPVNRTSFFAEQARHRRATWRLTAVCALAAIVSGLPLSLILAPLLFAIIILLTKLVDVVVGVPPAVWETYVSLSRVVRDAFDLVETASWQAIPWEPWLTAAGVWLLPGVLFMLLLWPLVRALFRRAGVGGVLLTLGARPPDLGDLEERQLVNVIEEMATAAGLPAPRVMLLDAGSANAAAIGSSPDDAVIIVARRLLDELDRDETQALLGHLVGSIGNGDLRVALTLLSIYQTFGLVGALLRAPIDGAARATVGRVLRFAFRRRGRDAGADAAAVTGLLAGGLLNPAGDDLGELLEDSKPVQPRPGFPPIVFWYFLPAGLAIGVGSAILRLPRQQALLLFAGLGALALALAWYQRAYLLYAAGRGIQIARAIFILPYYAGALLPQILLMMLISFILSPLIAGVWRTRRYLADATAVQLTRNPDALARALRLLAQAGGVIPSGRWAAPLFVVGPEIVASREAAAYAEALQERLKDRADANGPGVGGSAARLRAALAESAKLHQERVAAGGDASPLTTDEDQGLFGGRGSLVGFHPPLAKRLRRLVAQGALPGASEQPSRRRAAWKAAYGPFSVLMMALVGVLLALAGVLMVVAAVLLLGLGLFFCALLMLLVYGLLLLVAPAT